MDLSATDRETFESIKEIAKRAFNLHYSEHIYEDDLLSIIFRGPEKLIPIDYDLKIVLDTVYRCIIFRCRLPQPVPQDKIHDLYEVLNDVNYKLGDMKIVIKNPDSKVEFRDKLDLFKDAFSPDNFEAVLGRFLLFGYVLLRVVQRYLKGKAEKDEILQALHDLDNLLSNIPKDAPVDFPYLSVIEMLRQEKREVIFGTHLIFDSFPDKKAAEGFASMIRERYGRVTTVHETRKDADDYLWSRHDGFPFGLFPPIVLVERDPDRYEKEGEEERELEIEKLASEFGGTFVGT